MTHETREPMTPPSNQGGHREKSQFLPPIEASIDWLTYTCPIMSDYPVDRMTQTYVYPDDMTALTGEALKNPHGYTECRALKNGRVAWHPEKASQRFMVQFTGTDLGELRAANVKGVYLIAHALNNLGKVTRVDFAVDIKGRKADINTVRTIFEAGHANTQAGGGGSFRGITLGEAKVRPGETIYIGSPKSDRQMRIYDKGAEQGTNEDWLRVELVSRKALAHNLAIAMVTDGEATAGRQAIRSFLRLPASGVVARFHV